MSKDLRFSWMGLLSSVVIYSFLLSLGISVLVFIGYAVNGKVPEQNKEIITIIWFISIGLFFGTPTGAYKYSFAFTLKKKGYSLFTIKDLIKNPSKYRYVIFSIIASSIINAIYFSILYISTKVIITNGISFSESIKVIVQSPLVGLTFSIAVYWVGWVPIKAYIDPESLVSSLTVPDKDLRRKAAEKLSEYDEFGPMLIDRLYGLLPEIHDDEVQRSLIFSLEKILNKNFGGDPDKCIKWWEENRNAFLNSR